MSLAHLVREVDVQPSHPGSSSHRHGSGFLLFRKKQTHATKQHLSSTLLITYMLPNTWQSLISAWLGSACIRGDGHARMRQVTKHSLCQPPGCNTYYKKKLACSLEPTLCSFLPIPCVHGLAHLVACRLPNQSRQLQRHRVWLPVWAEKLEQREH